MRLSFGAKSRLPKNVGFLENDILDDHQRDLQTSEFEELVGEINVPETCESTV